MLWFLHRAVFPLPVMFSGKFAELRLKGCCPKIQAVSCFSIEKWGAPLRGDKIIEYQTVLEDFLPSLVDKNRVHFRFHNVMDTLQNKTKQSNKCGNHKPAGQSNQACGAGQDNWLRQPWRWRARFLASWPAVNLLGFSPHNDHLSGPYGTV